MLRFFQPSKISIPVNGVIEINPLCLSHNDILILELFFKQNLINKTTRADKVFLASTAKLKYHYYLNLPNSRCVLSIIFTNTIVRRSKIMPRNEKIYIYDVIGNEPNDAVGIGKFGRVDRVVKKIILTQQGEIRIRAVRQRVMKTIEAKTKTHVRLAVSEADIGSLLPHLKTNKLIQQKNTYGDILNCYLGMHEVAGKPLFDLLNEDVQKNYALIDLNNRILLCFNLAVALHEIHSLRAIHRDIKPDNILVNDNMQVRIIDVGFGLRQNGNDESRAGSLEWIAPEVCNAHYVPDVCNDNYSLGLIFNVIWSGLTRSQHPEFVQITTLYQLASKDEFAQLPIATEMPKRFGLTLGQAKQIVGLIASMLFRTLSRRANAEAAAILFERIAIERKETYLSITGREGLAKAVEFAKVLKVELVQHAQKTNPLLSMISYLKQKLSEIHFNDIHEEKIIIEYFVQVLGIEAFLQADTIEHINVIIDTIETNYVANLRKFHDLSGRIMQLTETLNQTHLAARQMEDAKAYVVVLLNELTAIITKILTKTNRSLDDFVRLNAKYSQVIADYNRELQAFERSLFVAIFCRRREITSDMFHKVISAETSQQSESAMLSLTN